MSPLDRLRGWFAKQGWTPYNYQEETWAAQLAGQSGLVHVPTGAGKTYASYIGSLAKVLNEEPNPKGLRILYVTPLKAVSRDIALALARPITDLGLDLRVEMRTGDTKASARAKQKKLLPQILVTTPESLSLLLSYTDADKTFQGVSTIILDEWHELLSSKRGSLLELALARLRRISPKLTTWALTATIANTAEAAQAAVGTNKPYVVVHAKLPRPLILQTLIPDAVDAYPWAGHLGLRMLHQLTEWLDPKHSTLIFANTRNQAERWFQAIRDAKPEWAGLTALHHGSLAREVREGVETGIKDGSIAFVVCTSSLDLGVDFGPVERVVQIGSPKSIARLTQRAGRSGHRPGETCNLLFVPTNSLELIEVGAIRDALARNEVEARQPILKPLDVLIQHLISRALGGGFTFEEIINEVREATSFVDVTESELRWALNFIVHGGESLQGYPAYHKVTLADGRYFVENARVARLHRLNIGTIVSDASVELNFATGKRLGLIEESFVSKLRRGDKFLFNGRVLEFLRMKDLKAQVKLGRGAATAVPSWSGGRLPFSTVLSQSLRRTLDKASRNEIEAPEVHAAKPVLLAQQTLSLIPSNDTALIEMSRTREGYHLFLYPFEGRLTHEGLAAVIALRLSRQRPATFSMTANDYGLELLSAEPFDFDEHVAQQIFSDENLLSDAVTGMNMAALAKMQFREISRVAGLVLQSYPGSPKTVRQVQISSSLLFDVFQRYDAGNLLLRQAERQVLERQMEIERMRAALTRFRSGNIQIVRTDRPTPFGFALIADRTSARLSSETLVDRLQKMKEQWSRP